MEQEISSEEDISVTSSGYIGSADIMSLLAIIAALFFPLMLLVYKFSHLSEGLILERHLKHIFSSFEIFFQAPTTSEGIVDSHHHQIGG